MAFEDAGELFEGADDHVGRLTEGVEDVTGAVAPGRAKTCIGGAEDVERVRGDEPHLGRRATETVGEVPVYRGSRLVGAYLVDAHHLWQELGSPVVARSVSSILGVPLENTAIW